MDQLNGFCWDPVRRVVCKHRYLSCHSDAKSTRHSTPGLPGGCEWQNNCNVIAAAAMAPIERRPREKCCCTAGELYPWKSWTAHGTASLLPFVSWHSQLCHREGANWSTTHCCSNPANPFQWTTPQPFQPRTCRFVCFSGSPLRWHSKQN